MLALTAFDLCKARPLAEGVFGQSLLQPVQIVYVAVCQGGTRLNLMTIASSGAEDSHCLAGFKIGLHALFH